MKRIFFLLFFIIMLMVPAFADYQVESINFSADVTSAGKTQVTTVFELSFDDPAASVTIPLPSGEVSGVSVSDYSYRIEREDDYTALTVSSKGRLLGTQLISVSYTIPAAEDSDDEEDLYSINLLSSRWGREIEQFSFSLSLPASDTALEEGTEITPLLESGYYGSTEAYGASAELSGTMVSCTLQKLLAYDTLSLTVSLPEGWFHVRQAAIPALSLSLTAVILAGLLLLVLLYWFFFMRFPWVETISRQLPPDGLLPCHMAYAMDGASCDLAALLLEWANLGYLYISARSRRGLILTKKMDMGTERSRSERQLFKRIFRGKQRAAVTKGRFRAAGQRYMAATCPTLNRILFDRKGGSGRLLRLPARLMAGVGVGYIAYGFLPDGNGYIVLAVLVGALGLLYGGELSRAVRLMRGRRSLNFPGLLLCLSAGALMVPALFAGTIPETGLGLLGCILCGFLEGGGPRRNERGREIYAQTKGCRYYYRSAPWRRLQHNSAVNSRYFQQQYPRAAALRSEKAFAALFEGISVPPPEWYPALGTERMEVRALEKKLRPVLRQLRDAFEEKNRRFGFDR